MNLVAISINHRTASVDKREAVHLSSEEIKNYLDDLKRLFFKEGFILSTCNRTEIFGISNEYFPSYAELEKFLIERKKVNGLSDENFQKYFSCSALNHLFNIVSGIDSQITGDNQIFGQTKQSFQIAEEKGLAGFLLKRVFDAAIHVGKRVKTETEISDGASNVSYAAIQIVEKIFASLQKKNALIIGAGETAELAAKNLHDKGIGKIAITNRTIEKAEMLAAKLHGRIIHFSQFKEFLHEFDIIISATSAEETILSFEEISTMMKKRNYETTAIMDLAIPRDIDSKVKSIENIFYHDVDSLSKIVEKSLSKRKAEIPKVQSIIQEELVNFYNWYNSLEVAPTIKSLRDYFESIRSDEVGKFINKFSDADKEKVEMVTKRIINKLLHNPTMELRKASAGSTASTEAAGRIALIREIFGIDASNENGRNE